MQSLTQELRLKRINEQDVQEGIEYLIVTGSRDWFVSRVHKNEGGWYFDSGKRGHSIYNLFEVKCIYEIE